MKRIALLLLSLLLLAGCAGAVGPTAFVVSASTTSPTPLPDPAAAEMPAGEAGPQAVDEPDLYYIEEPLMDYRYFDQPNWGELTSALMFSADLDQDGVEEPISFTLDRDEDTTAITWVKSTLVLNEGADFVEATILDLDKESPFLNLLMVIDYGSDSYVTIEAHPESGQLRKGPVIQGDWAWEDGALSFYERTDFLGTAFGQRTYHGDALIPDSEWVTMCAIPTAEELEDEEDREFLIDGGTLLHTILPVPCTINGEPGFIPENTYLYRLRFRNEDDLMEVALLDGTVAEIARSAGEDGWSYLIDGREMEEYFDNLFFAD